MLAAAAAYAAAAVTAAVQRQRGLLMGPAGLGLSTVCLVKAERRFTQFPTEVWWNSDLNPTMGVGVLSEGDDCSRVW